MNQRALKPINFRQQVFALFVLLFVGFGSLAGLVFDAGDAFGHHGEAHPSEYFLLIFERYDYNGDFYYSFTMQCPVCGEDRYYYRRYSMYAVYEVTRHYTRYYSGHLELNYESVIFLRYRAFDTLQGFWGSCSTCDSNNN